MHGLIQFGKPGISRFMPHEDRMALSVPFLEGPYPRGLGPVAHTGCKEAVVTCWCEIKGAGVIWVQSMV